MYRSFYCGLCRELRERYGIPGQISLTYDMTFVVLLLSGVYEPPTQKGTSRCAVHPLNPQPVRRNAITEYAADMNVILSYYKCVDDWKDEKKLLSFAYAKALRREEKKAFWRRYKGERISSCMELSDLEKRMNRMLIVFPDVLERSWRRSLHTGRCVGTYSSADGILSREVYLYSWMLMMMWKRCQKRKLQSVFQKIINERV